MNHPPNKPAGPGPICSGVRIDVRRGGHLWRFACDRAGAADLGRDVLALAARPDARFTRADADRVVHELATAFGAPADPAPSFPRSSP